MPHARQKHHAASRARGRARAAILLVMLVALSLLPTADARAQAPLPLLRALSTSAPSLRDSIVQLARAQVGRRYRHGGASPERGFDCSGLVQYVLGRLALQVPRSAAQQASFGVAVGRDTTQLRPGDLLAFTARGTDRVSHIGIYVGNGRFVHASSVAHRVIESPIDRPPAPGIKLLRGARRLSWDGDPPAAAAALLVPAPER